MTISVAISSPAAIGGEVTTYGNPRAFQSGLAAGTASTPAASVGEIWEITAEVDCFIEFNTNPNGSGLLRRRMKAGDTRYYMASAPSEKVAWAAA